MIQEFQGGNKLAGIYLGTVIQHCTHGYCKIWIPSVHPHEWCTQPDKLPAASQATSIFGGTNNGSGVFTYPNIGSIVYCFFANGDQNSPVYFAASLGGENAFGQYELIHPVGEFQSEKHRISSEKSWIQMEQHGELKLQVEDPDRRDTTVEYGEKYNDKISADHVSVRLSVDAINENELSALHCGIYLNNYLSNGTIDLQTYQSSPINFTSIDILSSSETPQVLTTVVDISSVDDRVFQDQIYDNKMNNCYDALSTCQKTWEKNTTAIDVQSRDILSTEQIYVSLDDKQNNYCHEDVKNNYNLRLTHKTNDLDTYAKYVKKPAEFVTSSYAFNDDYDSGIQFKQDQNVTIESLSSVKSKKTYMPKPTTIFKDELTSDVKNQLNMLATNGLDENFSRKQTEKHTYNDTAKNILSVLTIKNDNFDIDCRDVDTGTTSTRWMQGYKKITLNVNGKSTYECPINSTYKETISTKDQCITEEFVDNSTDAATELVKHIAYTKHISTKDQCITEEFVDNLANAAYTKNLDTSNKTKSIFEITIKNVQTQAQCKITLDTVGKMSLTTSSIISMSAPTINIDGTTAVNIAAPTININGTTTNINSSILNIMGATGDCTINDVSLLNHVHTEMQSGDVVAADTTKTKSAVASK